MGLQQILRLKSPVIQLGQGNKVDGQKLAETLALTGSVLDRGENLILYSFEDDIRASFV